MGKKVRAVKSDAVEACLKKLSESGLDEEDAKALGLEFLEPKEAKSLGDWSFGFPTIKINYFGWDNQSINWYRVRYLGTPTDGKKQLRYLQPPGTGVRAYFPRTIKWSDLATTEQIVITEGEFKAAALCKVGIPTIGLGGVYNWQSARSGHDILPELVSISWNNRPVVILFDSDGNRNPQVAIALEKLASKLTAVGAVPRIGFVPDLPGRDKTGVDDYLVAEGPTAIRSVIDNAEEPMLTRELHKLNTQFVHIIGPAIILDQPTDNKYSITSFSSNFQHLVASVPKLTSSGKRVLKEARLTQEWIRWPSHLQRQDLTYEPGHPKILPHAWNLWKGWGCEPKEGNVDPWYDLLAHIFYGADEGAMEWFIKWCAHPIQFPGTKLFSAPVIWGTEQGTGKSLIGYTLGQIYGPNFTEINQTDLQGSFNEWAVGRQFVMGEEITGTDSRHAADIIKKLITQKTIRINQKYIPTYSIPDCVNYIFTSNHPDAFCLDDHDRRFFIHEVTVGPKEREFYAEYDLWLHSDGPSALFYHLLHEVNTEDFDFHGPAFKTSAKEDMTEVVKGDLGAFIYRLKRYPDDVLRVGNLKLKRDLWTAAELLAMHDPLNQRRYHSNIVARELKRAGIIPAHGGKVVNTGGLLDVSMARLYIIRNVDKWRNASHGEIVAHLREHLTPRKPPYLVEED